MPARNGLKDLDHAESTINLKTSIVQAVSISLTAIHLVIRRESVIYLVPYE